MQPRVMLWANYRRGPSVAVPAPFDDNSSNSWWYDVIAHSAQQWAHAGFTDILFPNPVKGESGPYRTGDGYNPFDDYDIGSKNTPQFGGVPTRFGYDWQLLRAVAICKANGLQVHIDHVMHQRMGGRNGFYQYAGSVPGATGRFVKVPSFFRGNPPRVPQDPVPSPPDDFSFGDELCPVNGMPKEGDGRSVVWHELLRAGDWLFRRTGADGARLDDMKGMNIGFMKAFMTYGAMRGKWFFGEYASGNRNDTDWWVGQVDGLASASDFDFHYNMAQAMCEKSASGFDMRGLYGRGMIGSNPMHAVPFVESMDSDTNGFATIVDNKILGYALMLSGEGMPCVYARDYLIADNCYGLQPQIDNLLWIHNNLASGGTIFHWTPDSHIYCAERTGGPGLLVLLNNDLWSNQWHTVTVQTNFGPHVQLHDYTGKNRTDVWTDDTGRVTIGVPPSPNGKGYGMWSRAGVQPRPGLVSRSTTQTFFGARDLDVKPAQNATTEIGRVWCAADTPMITTLRPDKTHWTSTSSMALAIVDSAGDIITTRTKREGWHRMLITGASLPTDNAYELDVTYHAPKTLNKV